MAANECGAFSFAGGAVWTELNYNPNNLQLQSVTFANATGFDCAVEVVSPAGVQNAYTLPANQPQTQMNVGNQHVQLVQRAGVHGTVVAWPDDWALRARYPAT